ncbi:hypothetical protein [Variovorax ginsengisoli]|uniref:Uncharacterized protein n=1 Tax=Variovorax ginsengisoli TaxID=363844 RepID=A0ABT8SGT8_9BURK|nr:hypothetical protein [Variovorax ginsengisoli]MDN8618032.1 hypothetical protein [Variovorax ginsengisoli]MDO1537202.1 hypothetical protein [Variovorax ginsengisoli]
MPLAVAGAIGGAAGSVASQAVGMAIGTQDSFSWTGVALGAIGGAVAGGLGASGVLPDTSNAFFKGAIRAGVSSVASQGIAVVTGLQSRFSWKSVAASAVSGGVAQGLNAAMGYYPGQPGVDFNLGKSLVTGVGGSLVGQVVRGGKVNGYSGAS